ncbi:HipA domain-containing protein [Caballeronia sp. LZ062]|uniref:type II toxin-antitoxin system HipA family toxin n=1 Tax=unclassified Caballeronia TaxID=2646786 RepID=UPI00285EAD31|nr:MULTISPECIES: HipA domain-containing protein [unclassified Caballeronia]MDR5855715.1 HipA domain-containing protein [Caballeronia sp. LZ050]MDR5872498.1 HipA domain-containing protein [Caballeronia sp. LZ062]
MEDITSHLTVFANVDAAWQPCGQLSMVEYSDGGVDSAFEYEPSYLGARHAFELDPSDLSFEKAKERPGQPLRPSRRLSSFGALRDASPDAWGRRVIEAKLGDAENSLPEAAYLLHAGGQRVGAIDVRATNQDQFVDSACRLEDLPDLIEGAICIEEHRSVPEQCTSIFECGASLGGARPKACVRDDDDTLMLAKFSCANDRFNMPAVESATLNMAANIGLCVPRVKATAVNGHSVMLIDRFDRSWSRENEAATRRGTRDPADDSSPHIEHRIPFISALTLLGCDERSSLGASYIGLASVMRDYCNQSVLGFDLVELYRRIIFNIFVTNDDDHLRNHGFLYDSSLRTWRLSPLYDVLPSPRVGSERYLHLKLGGEGRLATLDNAVSRCDAFGLDEYEAYMLIGSVWEVVEHWRNYFGADGVKEGDMDYIASAIRHIDNISTEELRRCV